MAEACWIKGQKVTKREELDDAINEMLNIDEPYLLEVMVEKEANVFPMVPPGAAVTDMILTRDK